MAEASTRATFLRRNAGHLALRRMKDKVLISFVRCQHLFDLVGSAQAGSPDRGPRFGRRRH
jgi:hypothetical protein